MSLKMYFWVTGDSRSVELARGEAHENELLLIEGLFDRILQAEHAKPLEPWLSWHSGNEIAILAAKRHRSEVLPRLREIASTTESEHSRCRTAALEVISHVEHAYAGVEQSPLTSDQLAIYERLCAVGVVAPERINSARATSERTSGYTPTESFGTVLEFDRRGLWIDRKSYPCYPQLLDELSSVSNGLFRPEAILQWQGEPQTVAVPAVDDDGELYLPLQFIHDGRLYRTVMKDWGCWCDVESLFGVVAQAVLDSTGERNVVRVSSDCGSNWIAFGNAEAISAVALQCDVPISSTVHPEQVHCTPDMSTFADFVLDLRWDRIRMQFDESERHLTPFDMVGFRNDRGREGADGTKHDCDGQTPLHRAAESKKQEALSELLHHGFEVDVLSDEPYEAIHPDPLWELSRRTFRRTPEGKHWRRGQTPLHRAAFAGHENVVRLLLSHGADPDVRDCEGERPLDFAMRQKHESVVALLKSVS